MREILYAVKTGGAKWFLAPVVAAFLFAGCYTPPRLSVAPDVDLSQYKYVVISKTSDANSALMFGLEVEIGNLFPSYGFKIIGDKKSESLSEEEQQAVIVVRSAMSSSPKESICSIVVDDFYTGRTLVSARGSYGMGWNMDQDREMAMRRAMGQLRQVLQRKQQIAPARQ